MDGLGFVGLGSVDVVGFGSVGLEGSVSVELEGSGKSVGVDGDGVMGDVSVGEGVVMVDMVSNLSKASCKSSCRLDFSTAKTIVAMQNAVVAKAKNIATFFAVNTVDKRKPNLLNNPFSPLSKTQNLRNIFKLLEQLKINEKKLISFLPIALAFVFCIADWT